MEPRASVAVVVWRRKEPRFLLLRRAPAKGGGWQPVTGRVEVADGAGEAALLAAAAREVEEETGLAVVRVVDLGLASDFTGYDGHRYRERAFAAEVREDAHHRLSVEHDDAAWLTFDEALARLTWAENKEALRATRRVAEGV